MSREDYCQNPPPMKRQKRQYTSMARCLPVPLHIRNAPTSLMKEIGYSKGYKYANDCQDAYVPRDYLPEN
jgi:replication-associated recombination protein RarA